MSSPEEFPSPLRIYHSTKDANGDRRSMRLYLPAELVSSMERFLRQNTTFLSLHQYMLNCIFYGQEHLAEHGMADSPAAIRHLLETEDIAAQLTATAKLVETCENNWHKARTPDQRASVSAKILEIASQTTDPQIAHQLRQILA